MNKRIKKIAFVGLGSIASKHLKILEKHFPHIEVFIVTKRNVTSTINKEKKYIIFKNINSLKNKKIDAFFITSPSNEHYKAIKILSKEKNNFFIEKPIFHKIYNTSLTKNLLSKKNNSLIQIGYVFRHDDLIKKFKSLISKKYLGQTLKVDIYCGSDLNQWRPDSKISKSITLDKQRGGGVLLELSHEIDYCLWIFGKTKCLHANLMKSGKFKSNVDDTANIFLTNSKGSSIYIHLNFWQKNPERYCKVYGTNGEIKMDLVNRQIEVKTKKLSKKYSFKSTLKDAYTNQLKNFFRNIDNNKKSSVSIKEGIDVLLMINQIKSLAKEQNNSRRIK